MFGVRRPQNEEPGERRQREGPERSGQPPAGRHPQRRQLGARDPIKARRGRARPGISPRRLKLASQPDPVCAQSLLLADCHTARRRFGPRPDLVGRRVAETLLRRPGPERAVVAGARRYAKVNPASGLVPAHVVGRIVPGRHGGGRVLAVGVNGVIAATGRIFTMEGNDSEQFSLLIPERALRTGDNRLELLLAAGAALRPLGRRR